MDVRAQGVNVHSAQRMEVHVLLMLTHQWAVAKVFIAIRRVIKKYIVPTVLKRPIALMVNPSAKMSNQAFIRAIMENVPCRSALETHRANVMEIAAAVREANIIRDGVIV